MFPPLWGDDAPALRGPLWRAALLGALSSASWLAAVLVGVLRVVSPALSLAGFGALYGVVIGASLALTLLVQWAWPADARRAAALQ